MRDYNNDIERIIDKGFAPLPVDDAAAAKAVEAVLRNGGLACGKRKIVPLKRIESRAIYALAATLVLSTGVGYLVSHRSPSSIAARTAEGTPHGDGKRCGATVVSAVNSAGTDSASLRSAGDAFATGESSQLLLAIGARTRTVLFERSNLRVERTDSLRTCISLRQGLIAVDVAPGGRDTVSIVTAFGSFTQLGTRFSVAVDSIRGASVEVYRGSVSLQGVKGGAIILEADRAWESRGGSVTKARRSRKELEQLDSVFTLDRLERLLRLESDSHPHSAVVPEKQASVSRFPKLRGTTGAADVPVDVIRAIGIMADRGDLKGVDSAVARLNDPAIADTVAGILLATAERKKGFFRFTDARLLLEAVVRGTPFSMSRREDASVRRYMLIKTRGNAAPDDLLKELRSHISLFPAGAFGEDMASEEIELLMTLRNFDGAAEKMKRLLQGYPRHPQSEYYRYLLASTLRENLRRDKEALVEYKRYVTGYPDGNYGEDALYRIVQLSRSPGDRESAGRYRTMYLKRYPRGRWIEEVEKSDASVRK